MSLIDSLKRLFKNGAKVTEDMFHALIDALHNEPSEVTRSNISHSGLRLAMISSGSNHNFWIEGTATDTVDVESVEPLLIGSVEDFPILKAYIGEETAVFISPINENKQAMDSLTMVADDKGIFIYPSNGDWGNIPEGCRVRGLLPLILSKGDMH